MTFYETIMNMTRKKAEVLDVVKEVIENDPEVLFAYQYGSSAQIPT